MRASYFRLLALWTALLPSGAAAQWPGEVEGRVVDAVTGRGVEAATVELAGAPRPVRTDATGRFRLRSPSPGRHDLEVDHPGYVPAGVPVRVENGRTTRVTVELVPVLEVEGLTARASARPAGAYRVVPGEPGTAGARTLADLVGGLPGVTVTGRGPGGARTASIRGSTPDAVLVLVDGVPLNDPLTGEADLSLVPADAVEAVTVLPGARSARYGPGAQAGVVLVRTGGGPPGSTGPRGEASVGSLGRMGTVMGWTGRDAGLRWSLTASGETLDGGFLFERDPAVGGGRGTRTNTDLARWGIRGGADGSVLGGSGRIRLGVEGLERGLPGRSFAPSPEARQEERRLDLSAGWTGPVGPLDADVEAYGAGQRARFHDPAPPAGLPWDERTRVGLAGIRGRVGRPGLPGPVREVGVGWELEHQSVDAEALEGSAPRRRTDAAGFFTAELPLTGSGPVLRGTVRLDRDGSTGEAVGSHQVGLSVPAGPLTLRLAHRSSFSPPTLADRFFRAGFGVEPNPDLRAERVPSEVEAGVSATLRPGGWSVDAALDAYRADVRGMIVWSPDYRFVWSPRNVDVRRRGLDARVAATTALGPGSLHLAGSWSLARATYARADLRGLQLRYRPRHTGRVAAAWEGPALDLSVEARYVGSRLPVPSDVNRLPGFWTVDVTAGSALAVGGWRLEPTLRVDRVRGVRDSMIFAFPEPGRTVGLELAVRRAPGPP